MGNFTQHDFIVAFISAVAGALIVGLPAWIAVSQVRRSRLKSDMNDAVNAKIGDLVGGAFTNLLQLQRDAEDSLSELRSELESDSKRLREQFQGELSTILIDARRTTEELQRVAIRARASASAIDIVRETTASLGVDYDSLLAEVEAKFDVERLEELRRQRITHTEDLAILIEEKQNTDGHQITETISSLLKKYYRADLDGAISAVVMELKRIDNVIPTYEMAVKKRAQQIAEGLPPPCSEPKPSHAEKTDGRPDIVNEPV